MRRIIFALSLVVAGFAGFTLWQDPTTGPYLQALMPEGGLPSFSRTPTTSGTKSTNLGGMTAANRVADSVVSAVRN